MSYRQLLKLTVLYIAKTVGVFRLARFLTRRGLMIVCWHGISLGDEHERFPDLFISPPSFKQRLQFLKKNYNVIDIDAAIHQHREGRFQPRQVVLTFDDGYYNFVAKAAPILAEFNMTATVYLNTLPMENQLPNPILILRDVLLLTSQRKVQLSVLDSSQLFVLQTAADRAKLTRLLKDEMVKLPPDPEARVEFVKKIALELGVNFEDLCHRRVWHRLNCDEVRDLSKKGFSIEVHGHRHLNVVDYPDDVEKEVRVCQERIQVVTGKKPVHFCYPSGRWEHRAWNALSRAEIQSATVSNPNHGPNFPKTPALALRRVSNGESRCQLEFEFEMSNLRYLLSDFLRSGRRYEPPEKHTAGKSLEAKMLAAHQWIKRNKGVFN